MGDVIVLPADAPRRVELERRGWRVVARSFGAQLDGDAVDRARLRSLVDRAGLTVRALDDADVDAVLALDAATIGHYPGSVATRHEPFDRERATPSATRRGFGVWSGDDLVGMTFVDVLVGGGGAAAGSAADSDAAAVPLPSPLPPPVPLPLPSRRRRTSRWSLPATAGAGSGPR